MRRSHGYRQRHAASALRDCEEARRQDCRCWVLAVALDGAVQGARPVCQLGRARFPYRERVRMRRRRRGLAGQGGCLSRLHEMPRRDADPRIAPVVAVPGLPGNLGAPFGMSAPNGWRQRSDQYCRSSLLAMRRAYAEILRELAYSSGRTFPGGIAIRYRACRRSPARMSAPLATRSARSRVVVAGDAPVIVA